MSKTTETAADAYAARRASIDRKIEALKAELDAHAERAAASPKNWGFAGDLGRVEQLLDEITEPWA